MGRDLCQNRSSIVSGQKCFWAWAPCKERACAITEHGHQQAMCLQLHAELASYIMATWYG